MSYMLPASRKRRDRKWKQANILVVACFTICADGGANRFYDLMKKGGKEAVHVRSDNPQEREDGSLCVEKEDWVECIFSHIGIGKRGIASLIYI